MKQPEVVNVVLSHQPLPAVNQVVRWWLDMVEPEALLLLHTGELRDFEQVEHPQKVHAPSARVRTKDHQREMQSYTQLFAAVRAFCHDRSFRYVHFAEYDHLPLVRDLNLRQIELSVREDADLLAFRVGRVDGTNHVHYLNHLVDPRFLQFWESISQRSDPGVVLSMLGTGSFWRRAAFDAVAEMAEPFPMYLELYLPSLAHHLGFRVRDFGEQNRFVLSQGDFGPMIEQARNDGAWTLHPVKHLQHLPA